MPAIREKERRNILSKIYKFTHPEVYRFEEIFPGPVFRLALLPLRAYATGVDSQWASSNPGIQGPQMFPG